MVRKKSFFETIFILAFAFLVSTISGKEVVELFVGDVYASIIPPVKRLRGFKKISLQPGEISTVSFTLNKGDLSLINRKLERITEPDNFKVYVNNLTTKFYLK